MDQNVEAGAPPGPEPATGPDRHPKAAADGTIHNWESGLSYRPDCVVRPQSIDDVVAVVTDTARYPSPVRAVGSLHSPARCSADDRGTMLDMTGMNKILEIQPDFVRAEAGALYIDISEELKAQGLQFPVNTEIGNVTVGAVACAATKDGSLPGNSGFGQVSSYVLGMKLVLPDGTVRSFSHDAHPEEMKLLRSSYGLCGIVVEVTLAVRPTSALSVQHMSMTPEEFKRRLPDYIRDDVSIMMYMFPFANQVTLELRQENPDATPSVSWVWALRNAFWRRWAPFFALSIKRLAPGKFARYRLSLGFLRVMRKSMDWFIRSKRSWPHAQLIRYPDDPGEVRYVFSMWAFKEDRFFEIFEKYVAFCHEHYERTGFMCDLPDVGYRIIQDQNALLSYSYDGNVMSIDPVSTGTAGWDEFLREYNAFCSENGGWPLFNQTKHLTAEQVRKSFGARLETFAAARREWDPQDRLLSSYFADLLSETAPAAEAPDQAAALRRTG